uniref:Nitrilase and fragile histidine triad fusion protein NitFhit n=1 Tax=Timema genevievae TaxID=629358 RepID=A0A7R9JZL6_TIMGE|nr:unnamed protein product [Timema genevievae]
MYFCNRFRCTSYDKIDKLFVFKHLILCHTQAMATVNEKKIVGVGQFTAKNNKEENFEVCKNLIEMAKRNHCQMMFLPEACDYIGESIAETLALAEPLDGPLVKKYCILAKNSKLWLSLGGIHEKVSDDKVSNCHVVIDDNGNIASVYRKTHLFDVDLPEKGIKLMESKYVLPGSKIIPPLETPVGNCYDMRFPELSLALTKMGADLLTFPSAFTFATGAAHWETLLRARAIENQCYVVAAAQTGTHNKKRTSWGHAMVIDPWGTVVAQCSEGANMVTAEIDLQHLKSVRESMPLWKHRRNDLYPKMTQTNSSSSSHYQESYQFGQVVVKSDSVFYKTSLTFAFTNKKCVVPGHVLVAPIRCSLRLSDMTSEEISDMFLMVQKVQCVMEKIHQSASSSIVVQDGKDAGQTIKKFFVVFLEFML